MAQLDIYNGEGTAVGKVELNADVFEVEPDETHLHFAVIKQLANKRCGCASTKTRGEVRGGGKKPWKQKGTGRARQGSTRAPHWYHGAWAFGNQTRNYEVKQNKKERALALKSALAYKAKDKELVIVDSFVIDSNKTKDAKAILSNFDIKRNALIVVKELSDNLILATRNLDNILLLEVSEINVLDIVSADLMIVEEAAIKEIEEALK